VILPAVIVVTDSVLANRETEKLHASVVMKRKWIAGLLSLTLLPWTNVTPWPAPAFVSHASAASGTSASHNHHASNQRHPCCPQIKTQTVVTLAGSLLPCNGQHRCCFSRAPQAPGMPVATPNLRLGGYVAAAIVGVAPQRVFHASSAPYGYSDVARQRSALSTVLRI
jgi:hypothetical protein